MSQAMPWVSARASPPAIGMRVDVAQQVEDDLAAVGADTSRLIQVPSCVSIVTSIGTGRAGC